LKNRSNFVPQLLQATLETVKESSVGQVKTKLLIAHRVTDNDVISSFLSMPAVLVAMMWGKNSKEM